MSMSIHGLSDFYGNIPRIKQSAVPWLLFTEGS